MAAAAATRVLSASSPQDHQHTHKALIQSCKCLTFTAPLLAPGLAMREVILSHKATGGRFDHGDHLAEEKGEASRD